MLVKDVKELEKILQIKLTDKQKKVFHQKEKYLLWGGSSAAGKSFLLSFIALYYALKYDGATCLIGRKFQSSLTKTTQISFENLLNKLPEDYLKRHDKNEGYFGFKNNSRVYFVGLAESRESLKKLRGIELIFAGIDEAQDFDNDKEFLFLTTRLRQKVKGASSKLLLTCNPTREKWILDKWISGRKKRDFAFIKALPKDNQKNLPRSYLRDQKKILPRLQYRILILGSWKDAQVENCLFKQEEIEKARKRENFKEGGISYGIDVSLKGTTVIAKKSGNRITLPIVLRDSDIDEFMEKTEEEIKNKSLPVYVDSVGEGAGICVVLEREKYNVKRINQSKPAKDSDKYYNLRSENYDRLNLMLNELILPNDKELKNQMLNCKKDFSKEGKIKLETKLELHRRKQSPDKLDAVVLACVGEGKEGEEYGEDERGVYELSEEGKKIYLINYSIEISAMAKNGQIGRLEIKYNPEIISKSDLDRLKYQGFIRMDWIERRKRFFGYIEKYKKTGKSLDWINDLKFKF